MRFSDQTTLRGAMVRTEADVPKDVDGVGGEVVGRVAVDGVCELPGLLEVRPHVRQDGLQGGGGMGQRTETRRQLFNL